MNDELATVEQSFYSAMQAGDADALAKMISDECIYIHSFGSQDSKASYLEKVKGRHFLYRNLQFSQQEVKCRGPLAVVVGTMSGVVMAGGVERRLNNVRTSVWERVDDHWKLLVFQPTPWLDR